MREEDTALSKGKVVGGYRVEHRLGEGGMGTVYAAVEPTIGKRVAVKVLKADLLADASFVARFEREAKSAAQLRHPSVIEIFAYGKLDDGRPYFVMPLLVGRSLRQALDTKKRLAPEEAWRLARELASGLCAAHGFGVLHRDIKPDNVFLVEQPGRPDQPVLLDFGLAKIAAGSDADDGEGAKLTGTGVPLGTPLYMAPEQWWSEPATEATDQYGFGCLVFEMLTGRPPFEGTKYPELLDAHLHQTPPSVRSLGIDVAEDVDNFVSKLLAKDASGRFSSFEDVVTAGDAAFGREPAPIGTGAEPQATAYAPTIVQTSTAGTGTAKPSAIKYAATTVSVMALLPLVGYPGELGRDVKLWMVSIGFGYVPILLSSAIALLALPACAERTPTRAGYGLLALALAVSPAFFALLPTFMGWNVVVGATAAMPPAEAFETMHMGYYELSVAPFVGLGLTAAHAAGLASLFGDVLRSGSTATAPGRARLAIALAAVGGLGAATTLALGHTSAALALAAATLWLAVTRWVPPVRPDRLPMVIDRILASVVATLALGGVAFTRVESSAANAFIGDLPRAERIAAVVAASDERNALWSVLPLGMLLIAVGAWATHGGRILDEATSRVARARLPSGAFIAIGAIVLLTGVDVMVQRDFVARRGALTDQMREQLVFFAKLIPPKAEASQDLPQPAPATALQVSAESIALNGRGLGRLAALESDSGRQTILRELTSALATPTPGGEGSGVDLSLLVDRKVPVSRLRDLAALAYEAGARSAEVLLTRGALAETPARAPAEAGLLLPRDFVALKVELAARPRPADGDTSFEVFAADLQAHAETGRLAIEVGRPAGP